MINPSGQPGSNSAAWRANHSCSSPGASDADAKKHCSSDQRDYLPIFRTCCINDLISLGICLSFCPSSRATSPRIPKANSDGSKPSSGDLLLWWCLLGQIFCDFSAERSSFASDSGANRSSLKMKLNGLSCCAAS